MKLSEAIRLGAMLGPQTRMRYIVQDYPTMGQTSSCAIGAAILASGISFRGDGKLYLIIETELAFAFPILSHVVEASTSVDDYRPIQSQTVWTVIIHLNDRCNWSREQIADWVEKIENEIEESRAKEEYNVLVGA